MIGHPDPMLPCFLVLTEFHRGTEIWLNPAKISSMHVDGGTVVEMAGEFPQLVKEPPETIFHMLGALQKRRASLPDEPLVVKRVGDEEYLTTRAEMEAL